MTLRERRQQLGVHLRQLEETTGINRGTLSRIETGQQIPTPGQLANIALALNCDPLHARIRVLVDLEGGTVNT